MMADTAKTIAERAYELAQSGTCSTYSGIKQRLRTEGFSNVEIHLGGKPSPRSSKKYAAPLRSTAKRIEPTDFR